MIMKVQERRRQYRASIPGVGKVSYQKKYDKAMAGRDPQAAIAAKCLDCMYWQRTRIAECPIVCCPLWLYRPFTSEKVLSTPAAPKKTKRPHRVRASAARLVRV
jgi:hypothetical protein